MGKTIVILMMLSIGAFADLFELRSGTYEGKTVQKNRDVDLYLVDYPGREGSFLALLLSEDEKAWAYLVDKFAPNTYGMVPLEVMQNGIIGFTNPNPSLNMKISLKGRRRMIQIVGAGDLNNRGFKGAISFKYDNDVHKLRLSNILAGSYKYKSRKRLITVGNQDHNNEAYFTASTGVLDGDFMLREVRPGLHLPLKSVLKSTGIQVSEDAQGMIVFIDKRCVLGEGTHMLYINNNGNVNKFKKI